MVQTETTRGLRNRETLLLRSLASSGRDLFTVRQAQQELGADAPCAANILCRLAVKAEAQKQQGHRRSIVRPAEKKRPLPRGGGIYFYVATTGFHASPQVTQ